MQWTCTTCLPSYHPLITIQVFFHDASSFIGQSCRTESCLTWTAKSFHTVLSPQTSRSCPFASFTSPSKGFSLHQYLGVRDVTSPESSVFVVIQIKNTATDFCCMAGVELSFPCGDRMKLTISYFTLFFVRFIPLAFSISASFSAFFLSNSACFTFSSCAFRNNLTKFNRVAVTAVACAAIT